MLSVSSLRFGWNCHFNFQKFQTALAFDKKSSFSVTFASSSFSIKLWYIGPSKRMRSFNDNNNS